MLTRGNVKVKRINFELLVLTIPYTMYCSSHITEKAIRRRYGRLPRNVRAFIYLYNRLGHRGTSTTQVFLGIRTVSPQVLL